MQGEGNGPLFHQFIRRALLRSQDIVVADALTFSLSDDHGIVGIENHLTLTADQLALISSGVVVDLLSVVEDDTEVAHTSHAGLTAHCGLPVLDTRIAEHAFLAFHPLMVEIDFLIWTGRHALSPTTAAILVDEHHAVLALVDSTRGTAGDTGRMQAVLAQTGHVEHERTLEGLEALRIDVFEIRVALALVKCSGKIILPVRTVLHLIHLLTRDHREGTCRRWCLEPPLAF